mgnify:FL=1
MLPDQNTELRLDSLDSIGPDQDNTIPMIPMEHDESYNGIYDTDRKMNKRGTDLFEGGEEKTIVITNEDQSAPLV